MSATPVRVRGARFLASAPDVRQLPAPMYAEIAFAGKSNVGKSSLIGSLLGRKKLVRVSATPGCTRGLNLFRVELEAGCFDFVDLPGYGYAKRSKAERLSWGPMIEGFLRGRAGLAAVIVIVDVRRGLTEEDEQLLGFLEHIGRDAVVVATKLDKLPLSKRKPALQALERGARQRVYGVSSVEPIGHDPLWRALLRALHIEPSATTSGAGSATGPESRNDGEAAG